MEKQLERFYARISFMGEGTNDIDIYNREVFDDLFNIKPFKGDNSQFIEIGDTLTVRGKKYVVEKINIKLYDHLHDMEFANKYGVNATSPTEPTNFNLQIGVFVKKLA